MSAVGNEQTSTEGHWQVLYRSRLRRRCPLIVAGVLSVFPAVPVFAQVTGPFVGIAPVAGPTQQGKGPGGDQFSISPTVSTVYDSNVLRTNERRGGSAPRDDVRVTPSVSFGVRQAFARNTVSVSGDVGYDFYRRFKGLNRLRATLNAAGRIPFGSRCSISPAGSVQIQQSEIEDLGEAVGRTARIVTGEVVARCPRPAGFSPVVRADFMTLSNSGGDSLSRMNWSATGGLVYAQPSVGQFQIFANGGQFRRSGDLGGPDTGADLAGIGLQFDRAITSRFATRLLVSAVRVTPTRTGGRQFEGVNYIADVRIAPIPSLVLSPTLSRQVVGSINTGSDYVISRDMALGLTWSVGPRTAITGKIGRSRRRYFGEDPLVIDQLRIADATDTAGVGVRYAVRSLGFQLGVTYRERDSRNDFYNFASTRVEFSARAGF